MHDRVALRPALARAATLGAGFKQLDRMVDQS